MRTNILALCAATLLPLGAMAQLSQNPDKFIGNITTQGKVDTDGIEYWTLWNQITPENESKWESIEGTNNSFNWWGCDNIYNYAKEHNFPFKFHTLIWGSQYPKWMDNLSTANQYKEIIQWMDAVKERYPDLEMIDVVNEAIPGHAPAPYKNALGGSGKSGYDWIVKAFELAHERWPNAILIYNDYNTFQWNTNEFINLVTAVRDAGAPIDAYGCQSHDLTDCSFSTFKSSMSKIQNALKMPMYSTEYDIGTADDQKQLRQYKDQIPYMWEQEYMAGITLWGFIYGKTWVTDGNSGIIRNGEDRPAMTWLREYMASDAAKNAKGPFPGGKKTYAVYIRPESPTATLNEPFNINIDATLYENTIDHIDFYINGIRTHVLTEAPYDVEYIPVYKGKVKLKAVVVDANGKEYERLGGFTVVGQRSPFHGTPISLPGIVQAEDFDIGGEGASFHDSDSNNEGTNAYRTDGEGVDIVAGGTGYAIGHTATGEWLEYTVEVKESGKYSYEAYASSGLSGSSFTLSLIQDEESNEIANISVPNSGDWNQYSLITGPLSRRLSAGSYILRLDITGSYANIDYINIYKRGAGIDDIEDVTEGVYDVYTTTGICMGQIEISNANEYRQQLRSLNVSKGIYVLRNQADNHSTLVQF